MYIQTAIIQMKSVKRLRHLKLCFEYKMRLNVHENVVIYMAFEMVFNRLTVHEHG